jgi:hypothetical protein
MGTHQPENEKPVRLTVSEDNEVAIRQHADRVGKQLGEAGSVSPEEALLCIHHWLNNGQVQAVDAVLTHQYQLE